MRRAVSPSRRRAALVGASLIALVLALVAPADRAQAAPPENADPAFAAWFQSLRQPGSGISCCSIADCRIAMYRTSAGGYEALIDDKWLAVPPEKVLQHINNPTGRAVVCYTPSLGILCFVRPSET